MSEKLNRLRLFDGIGVELEYMIVDAETLSVRPIADELIRSVTGEYASEVEHQEICWSNELVLHVIELKTNGPARSLNGLAEKFQEHVKEINRRLAGFGARLMPSAMHPWMDPLRETRLWPHEFSPVYAAYNRIFSCQGHGWSNLQSTHLNLPFSTDEEFGRLHAAVRLVLPLLPALAASSPIADGRRTDWIDNRLAVYRANSSAIPSITGQVIPEPVFARTAYENEILQPMYRDVAPFDPDRVLQDEFLNSRGAIARFSRGSIEIRLLDIQECPMADIAIATAVVDVIRALVEEHWSDFHSQCRIETGLLESIFLEICGIGQDAVIDDQQYLAMLGIQNSGAITAGGAWQAMLPENLNVSGLAPAIAETLQFILRYGSLAQRIIGAVDGDYSSRRLKQVYGRLCDCLEAGHLFGQWQSGEKQGTGITKPSEKLSRNKLGETCS